MQDFDYQKMASLQEGFNSVSTSNGTSVFMAGGTDVLVKIKEGKIQPQRVIDIKGVKEMGEMVVSKKEFSIGALTTIRTLERSEDVRAKIPILAVAASKLGSIQVRNRATIGGNVCNAAPSSETAPALLALDAQAEIFGKTGKRVVGIDNFFVGPGTTVLQEGEILTALKIPLIHNPQGSVYYKLATRKAMDLAFVGVAVLLVLNRDGTIGKARIVLGAVAPTPIRVITAENSLEGTVIDNEIAGEAAKLAAQACKPISDLRATAEYRREMVNNLCQRGLLAAYRYATYVMEN